MRLKMIFHIASFTAFFLLSLVAASSDWRYPNLEADEEFPKWGGLCDNGIRQSPIDLSMNGAFKSDFGQLKFENYNQKQQDSLMVNNGHSIQLYGFPKPMKLNGGPLIDEFVVEQLHFHWWSEHTINNIRYPLECHIVHRNLRYANMSEAATHKDGIAVVGILYHVSNTPNEAIANILKHIDDVKSYDQVNKPVKIKEYQVSQLLPKLNGYFNYAGSLTTPTCAESVIWLILSETVPVTLEQVAKFKEVEYDKDKYLLNNYRYVQKSHNRAVVAVTFDDGNNDNKKNKEDSAAGLQISFGVIFLMTFVSLFH